MRGLALIIHAGASVLAGRTIDHAGPSLVLAVLSREPRCAGAFVLAFLQVHASSIVGAGG